MNNLLNISVFLCNWLCINNLHCELYCYRLRVSYCFIIRKIMQLNILTEVIMFIGIQQFWRCFQKNFFEVIFLWRGIQNFVTDVIMIKDIHFFTEYFQRSYSAEIFMQNNLLGIAVDTAESSSLVSLSLSLQCQWNRGIKL